MNRVATEFDDDANRFCSASITFDEARTVIGKAFCGTDTAAPDPLYEWALLEPLREKQQTPEQVQSLACFMMGFPVYENKNMRKAVFLGERDEKTGTLMSCLVLEEYNPAKRGKPWKMVKGWYGLSGFLKMMRSDGAVPDLFNKAEFKTEQKQIIETFDKAEECMDTWHQQYAPSTTHWYVNHLGVHPDYQGRKCGTRLMKKMHQLADAQGMSCYLECSGEKNVAFYSKVGYREAGRETMKDPNTDSRSLDGFLMTREPSK